jgi:hypothetical protein
VYGVVSSTSSSFWLPQPPFIVLLGVPDDKPEAGDAKYQCSNDGELVVLLTVVREEGEVRTRYARHGWRGEE